VEGNYHGLLEVLRKTMQNLSSDGQVLIGIWSRPAKKGVIFRLC